jgi:hypothetical protein
MTAGQKKQECAPTDKLTKLTEAPNNPPFVSNVSLSVGRRSEKNHGPRFEEAAQFDPSTPDDRLRAFVNLVRSFGIDHGICFDRYHIKDQLSAIARERVLAEECGKAERRRLARNLALEMVMARGVVPAEWTAIAICSACGPVWAAPDLGANIEVCPWCDLRQAGRWFPRPRMQCGKCRNFQPDTINPAGGLGSCRAGFDAKGLCYPKTRPPCPSWRGRS